MHKLRLGLVCISEVLKNNRKVAFKTMTRKQYLSMPRTIAIQTLSARTLHNASTVRRDILPHLSSVGISHYRVSSSMFPLITDKTLGLSYDDLPDMQLIRDNLAAAGLYARVNDISISCHPDQYNVLASYSEDVVTNSINELNHQSNVLDMMGLPQDLSSSMCLHLNASPKQKIEDTLSYRQRFIDNLARCNSGVRARLVLENEDKGFWNCDNLYNFFHDVRPLVYDNLHDACNKSEHVGDVYATMFASTWKQHRPIFHWSEGIDGTSKHARRASHIPEIIKNNGDICTWEVELKDKDYAILDILEKYSKEIV
jgi:UV DNA damage endonuclease